MPIWGGKPSSAGGAPCALNPTEPVVTYQIPYSLRFRRSGSTFLSRTFNSGNRKTWTLSMWVKIGAPGNLGIVAFTGVTTGSNLLWAMFGVDGISITRGIANVNIAWNAVTSAIFRDHSAWYNATWVYDTTKPNPSDRVKVFVNGVQISNSGSYPALDEESEFNSALDHTIGGAPVVGHYDGHLADIHFIDGQALDPTSFGEFDATTGVWMPKAYAGAYGANGFRLKFDNPANLGEDSSGNGNHWTANNFSLDNTQAPFSDQMVDSPTNYGTDTGLGGEVRGNYPTLNPLDTVPGFTLVEGNLSIGDHTANSGTVGTIAIPKSGKYYWETQIIAGHEGFFGIIDAAHTDSNLSTATSTVRVVGGWAWYNGIHNYDVYKDAALAGNLPYFTVNDFIGMSFDVDNNVFRFYLNGVVVGPSISPTTPLSGYVPWLSSGAGGHFATAKTVFKVNFGQRPFKYPAPAGFKSLCSTNLPKAQLLPKNHFDIVLDTGANIKAAADAKNMPGLVWIKDRQNSNNHQLIDVLRGANALYSNDVADEGAYAAPSGDSVAWLWRGGDNAVGVANTDGSIPSTVRACKGAGFSIVTYTGTGVDGTVGHGLGVVPSMVILKRRAVGGNTWLVKTSALQSTHNLRLQETSESLAALASGYIGDLSSSSTVTLTAGGSGIGNINDAGAEYVAYVFAEVPSFSKFGSFVGNGSATDGSFVYTSFAPKWVLIKKTNSGTASDWEIHDTTRDTSNVSVSRLYPNLASREDTINGNIDILSNGFKMRNSDERYNELNSTYIYAAFAEHPFTYGRAR